MDISEFSKNFDRIIAAEVHDAMKDTAKECTALLARLTRQYQGQPVSVIKPVLRREWEGSGGTMNDDELTDYATLISEGTRVRFEV